MRVLHRRRRWALLAFLLILAMATGCSGEASPKAEQSSQEDPARPAATRSACGAGTRSSTLMVQPASAAPGSKVKVTSTSGCVDEARSRKRLPIYLGFAPGRREALQAGTVRPSADGSFDTTITVPPTAQPGDVFLTVGGWYDDLCRDGGSCASYAVPFTIQATPP